MAFQVSPGVLVQEKDLTRIIPAVSTSIGAVAFQATQGPLDEIVSISSEQELVSKFGKPNSTTFEGFFTAANFLAYSNSLRVVRVQNSSVSNATESGSAFVIKNTTDYQDNYADGSASVGLWAARTAGVFGNSLSISTCPSATVYEETSKTTVNDASTTVGDTVVTVTSASGIAVGDVVNFGDEYEYRVVSISTNDLNIVRKDEPQYFGTSDSSGLHAIITNGAAVRRRWRHYDLFDKAPGTSPFATSLGGSNDELHIAIVNEATNTIVERMTYLSKLTDGKSPEGNSTYWKDYVNEFSGFIYAGIGFSASEVTTAGEDPGAAIGSYGATAGSPLELARILPTAGGSLSGGADDYSYTSGEIQSAYDEFLDTEATEIDFVLMGGSMSTENDTIAKAQAVAAVANSRKDCIAFISPYTGNQVATNGGTALTQTQQLDNTLDFFANISSSSFVVLDSGVKYTYDRFNDKYRYVGCNGDVAGLCVSTSATLDDWFSPAGLNRGGLQNVVKLAFNPNKAQRDDLYTNRINPIVSFPGSGPVLFGDKTGLASPSAFDRINVRRLFLNVEKRARALAESVIFEQNDAVTRSNFNSSIASYLSEIQARRGLTDYLVVCDGTNNTPEVIDRNEFVAELYLKPTRSINYVTVTVTATKTGVSFEEVVGRG